MILTLAKNNYLSVVYNERDRPKTEYPNQLISYLINRFNIKKCSRILDVGCGNKNFLDAFKDTGMEAIGVDLFNNGDESILEVNFEIDKSPFPDNSFDICFSKSIVEHLNNPDLYISEIYRVLKPNGRLILMVPEYDSCQYLYWDDYTHKQPYRLNSVRDLLLIHKFCDVNIESFYQLPVVWKYPVLKIICKFLQLFGAPKKIVKNKFLRFSREKMILSTGVKI